MLCDVLDAVLVDACGIEVELELELLLVLDDGELEEGWLAVCVEVEDLAGEWRHGRLGGICRQLGVVGLLVRWVAGGVGGVVQLDGMVLNMHVREPVGKRKLVDRRRCEPIRIEIGLVVVGVADGVPHLFDKFGEGHANRRCGMDRHPFC